MLMSCKKNNSEPDSLKCINGDWTYTTGLEILGSDTAEFFQNGLKYKYWYGRRVNTYPSNIKLSISNNGQFHFLENIEGYQIDTSLRKIYDYVSDWKLLNTSESNTHIKMKIHFEYPDVFDVHHSDAKRNIWQMDINQFIL